MSRIGKQPIPLPEGVKVDIQTDKLVFRGEKGSLTSPLLPGITAKIEEKELILERENDLPQTRSFHGLNRTLASNCCVGVSKGFSRQLEIVGVGYRAKIEKNRLELNLGYSKPVIYTIPKDIEIVVEKPTQITVKGIDKQRVGQESHIIRSFRPPEPYKLKGIRYSGERLIKKERKAGVVGA
ncbi:MAG: 50S ribosomal protein L6 [Acidobacteria bacterium]|nr:50S ribosomal protein L6 [Acidobacteriota bacterium]MBU1337598.1 50S ribosomal protein L6 [Acidobacteriota bacterium]MBU1474036.1 50S ribosomal protein L6 [Acidobacteriota bacterium]MBU4494826.1 50S ribosomal protein L6 [Acidobacteriota bacterium]